MPPQTLDRDALWSRSGGAAAGLERAPACPVLVVDLDAFAAVAPTYRGLGLAS